MRRKNLLFALCALILIGLGSWLCLRGGMAPAHLALLDECALLLLAVAAMVGYLRASLRRTLYSYTNICLIGLILFASVMTVLSLVGCISFLRSEELSMQDIYRSMLSFPRHFSYYAVFLILFVSVLVGISNVVLSRREGLCLNNALSLVVAGFYIGGTVLVYWITDWLEQHLLIPRGVYTDPVFAVLHLMIPLFLLLMLCYLDCVLVGTAALGWMAARRKPSYDKDFIIILGCSIDKRGGLLPLLKGRVNRAIRFAWEQEIATGKSMKYVPSGGQGPNEIMSEGSAMELYLLSRGAEPYEVFPEKRSTDTWENMCFSKRIIDELKPGARVAFATTNYHILRSGILARRAGLDAEGIAGDTKWYFWPNGFVREFFGILAMNVKAHLLVALITAILCAAVGLVGYTVSWM